MMEILAEMKSWLFNSLTPRVTLGVAMGAIFLAIYYTRFLVKMIKLISAVEENLIVHV